MTDFFGDINKAQYIANLLAELSPLQVNAVGKYYEIVFSSSDYDKANNIDHSATGAKATVQMRNTTDEFGNRIKFLTGAISTDVQNEHSGHGLIQYLVTVNCLK